jgi:hypothetical protein
MKIEDVKNLVDDFDALAKKAIQDIANRGQRRKKNC